jgi:hypothetical protein
MSRHRTTLKMHRVKDKRATAKLAENEVAASEATANGARDKLATQADDALTTETLGRYLAAEVSLRESGEERGATALARYFKLTLVMAGLNMLVASASVVMVFSRSDKPQTIVVTPPAPAAAPVAPREPATKVVAAPTPPAPTPPAVPPPAPTRIPLLGQPPSPPARIPLLGRPRSAPKRAVAAKEPRAPRVSIPPPMPSTPVFARNTPEEHPPVPVVSETTERW